MEKNLLGGFFDYVGGDRDWKESTIRAYMNDIYIYFREFLTHYLVYNEKYTPVVAQVAAKHVQNKTGQKPVLTRLERILSLPRRKNDVRVTVLSGNSLLGYDGDKYRLVLEPVVRKKGEIKILPSIKREDAELVNIILVLLYNSL